MPNESNPPFINAMSGAFAGVVAVCVSYPFDLIKTRMHHAADIGQASNFTTVTKTVFNEGFKTRYGFLYGVQGFYSGLQWLVPEAACKTMCRFFTFKSLQEAYKDVTGSKTMPLQGNLLCGATAGLIETTLIVQPYERAKTLSVAKQSPLQIWSTAFQSNGMRGGLLSVYTGYTPCLLRQVGNQATSLTIFYHLKQRYNTHYGVDMGLKERLVCGFIAGASASQKETGSKKATIKILLNIYKQKGIFGCLLARVGRVGIDRAVGFWAFETLSDVFMSYRKKMQ